MMISKGVASVKPGQGAVLEAIVTGPFDVLPSRSHRPKTKWRGKPIDHFFDLNRKAFGSRGKLLNEDHSNRSETHELCRLA